MFQNGPCKLCGKNAKLLRKSHIIPNFMYRGLFDENNKMSVVPLNNPQAKPQFAQTGFFEKYILCEKCDNVLLGSLEKYAATLIYGGSIKNPPIFEGRKSKDGLKSVFIKNVDYAKFKLFVLSVLWRAHVSQHRFFKKVDISDTEATIRKMLLAQDAGNEGDFKISIIGIKGRNEDLVRVVPDPEVKRVEGMHLASFFIGGFIYFINLDSKSNFTLFDKIFLKANNEIEIPIIEGEVGNRFLKAIGLPDNIVDYFVPFLAQ